MVKGGVEVVGGIEVYAISPLLLFSFSCLGWHLVCFLRASHGGLYFYRCSFCEG